MTLADVGGKVCKLVFQERSSQDWDQSSNSSLFKCCARQKEIPSSASPPSWLYFFFGLRAALGRDCLFTSLSVVAKCLESVQGNQQLPPPIECLLSELCAVRAPSPTLEQQLL